MCRLPIKPRLPACVRRLRLCFCCGLILLPGRVHGQSHPELDPAYAAGFTTVMRLGADLRARLPAPDQALVHPVPVFLKTEFRPSVDLVEYRESGRTNRAVFLSLGFVDLANRIAHAAALDPTREEAFLQLLAIWSGETGLRRLATVPAPTLGSDEAQALANAIRSDFNSIAGVIIGIHLAHFLLGHGPGADGGTTRTGPVTPALTPRQWNAALDKGAALSVGAGCAVEGAVVFFEAFDRMEPRPAWADQFLPSFARGADAGRRLLEVQQRLFSGEEP